MSTEKIIFQSIGIIHSPHRVLADIPIQPVFSKDVKGTVVVAPEFSEGLMDLNEFSHIYLFYCFHQSQKMCLHVKPFLSDQEHGIFATRSPHRPNKLGMSLVRLTEIAGPPFESAARYLASLADVIDVTSGSVLSQALNLPRSLRYAPRV